MVGKREKGECAFRAESVAEDSALTDGELTCRAAEDGILFRVDNALSDDRDEARGGSGWSTFVPTLA